MSYYKDRIKALEARIEEMAMLNRMKAIPVEAKLLDRIGELNKENARLKAEVERLTNNCDYLDQKLDEELDKSAMLCGQVERMTKAGDAMAMTLQADFNGVPYEPFVVVNAIIYWRAAKEGKQS